MRVDAFDFELPEEHIALRPISPRDRAKLLVVRPPAELEDRTISERPDVVDRGELLVFKDTQGMRAALHGRRLGRGDYEPAVSVLLFERLDGARWKAFAKPGKHLKAGDRISFGDGGGVCLLGSLDATVEHKGEEGEITLAFDFTDAVLDEAIAVAGHIPLPPYISARRPADERDSEDYQTVYAREQGAVAAPTAGLHFTPALLDRLAAGGVRRADVVLHVGAGTFKPVEVDDPAAHVMHEEWYELPAAAAATLNQVRAGGGRAWAVG